MEELTVADGETPIPLKGLKQKYSYYTHFKYKHTYSITKKNKIPQHQHI